MMSESKYPDIVAYVCHNCIPDDVRLPRQWRQDGVRVEARQIPCSGKMDVQYLFHALEAGAQGILVITCLKGECRLAQGNYRAEVRVHTVQRLLEEIGLEPERARLVQRGPEDDVETLIREAAGRFCALGESPLRAASPADAG